MRSSKMRGQRKSRSSFRFATLLQAMTVLVGIAAIMNACTYQDQKAPETAPAPGETTSGAPSFQTVYDAVFAPRCVSCHGSAGGVNLSTYQNVVANLSQVETVIRQRTMPPNSALPLNEETLVLDWINAGAPEQAGSATPVPSAPKPSPTPETSASPSPTPTASASPAALVPTYTSIRANIFEPYCLQCHAAGRSASFLRFDTYSSVANSSAINRTNPSQSDLIIAVQRTDSQRMPPPSTGLPHLTPEQIDVMTRWIQLGLPE